MFRVIWGIFAGERLQENGEKLSIVSSLPVLTATLHFGWYKQINDGQLSLNFA